MADGSRVRSERVVNQLADDDLRVLKAVAESNKGTTTSDVADVTGLPLKKVRYRAKKLAAGMRRVQTG